MMELSLTRRLQLHSNTAAKSTTTSADSVALDVAKRWVLIAALLSLACKLAIAYNTFGTNDVTTFYMFARSLNEHGLEWTYRYGGTLFSNGAAFNHPPATAYFLELIDSASRRQFFQSCGFTFPFLLRLPGIVADFVVVFILLRFWKTRAHTPLWSLTLFAISPVSLMVSGFHGNTDPVMVMFLVLAALACSRAQPILCAVFLALSCQVKIIPLLLLPATLLFWATRRMAVRFTIVFAFATVVPWLQPLVQCPELFLKNVFGYNSYWGTWGITYLLRLTGWPQFNGTGAFHLPALAAATVFALKCLIISLAIILAWRRRVLDERALAASLSSTWILFFVFSPGIAPQYMIWLAPFVLMSSSVFYVWLTATSAIFLFVFYNTTAGGLPWYYSLSSNAAEMVNVWTPWSLLPWATLIVGTILFWKKTTTDDLSLPLFNFKTLPAKST
jgi:hypothetical protein